jgi:hypothetical protein
MFGVQRIYDAPRPIPACPKCGKFNTVVPLQAVRLREGAHAQDRKQRVRPSPGV